MGVAVIEELYVRGLLLGLIEKMFEKRKNSTLIAVVSSVVIFGVGHIFGKLGNQRLSFSARLSGLLYGHIFRDGI